MKTKTTKLPFFAFLSSFFAKGKRISKTKEVLAAELQTLDIYTQYRNLYLDPTTTIRSRAKDLNISRHKSEELTKRLKNIQRNKRIEK